MTTKSSYLEAPRRLRAFVRAHETSLVVLAVLIGAIGGLVVAVMGMLVSVLHAVLFNLPMATGCRASRVSIRCARCWFPRSVACC